MQNILVMHGLYCTAHLVQAPSDEAFSEVLRWIALFNYVGHGSTVHEFKYDPDAPLVVINGVTSDQMWTI